MIDKWDRHFMRMAVEAASMSKDPSTRVGAVAVRQKRVVATGFNGFPFWLEDLPARLSDRPFKYKCIHHAEENLILDAARRGTSLEWSSLYVTHPPCFSCFAKVTGAGIRTIYFMDPDPSIRYRVDIFDDFVRTNRLEVEIKLAGIRTIRMEASDVA